MSEFSDDVLILIGHGAAERPASRDSATHIADALHERRLFKAVHAGFLKHPPFAKDLLETLEAGRVFLVPHMAHAGYITGTVIPRELGLDGGKTVRATPRGAQTLYLCEPVGVHPAIPKLIRARIDTALRANAIDPAACAVILVGHGSGKSDTSAQHTHALAGAVAALGPPLPVHALFLEQAPFLRDWAETIENQTLLVTPFLMSSGAHSAEDIPAPFGIDPADVHFGGNTGMLAGPFEIESRIIWLQAPLGDDPAIADIVFTQVQAALDGTSA